MLGREREGESERERGAFAGRKEEGKRLRNGRRVINSNSVRDKET